MDPVTLITTALTLATPFLIKSGEKFAETVGEDIWKWIKKPFVGEDEKKLISDFKMERDSESIKMALLEKMNENNQIKEELEKAVNNAQKALKAYHQQNINNNGQIDKQVNIQNLTGDINF